VDLGAVPRKLVVCGHNLILQVFLILLWGTYSWFNSKHFRCILCLCRA